MYCYSLMFGAILWFLILDGYKEGNTNQQSPVSQLFLKTAQTGEGSEKGDGFPEIPQFPAFTAGEQCVEGLYSPLFKLHRQHYILAKWKFHYSHLKIPHSFKI